MINCTREAESLPCCIVYIYNWILLRDAEEDSGTDADSTVLDVLHEDWERMTMTTLENTSLVLLSVASSVWFCNLCQTHRHTNTHRQYYNKATMDQKHSQGPKLNGPV